MSGASFGAFLIQPREVAPWKSEWRREFERRSAEDAAHRRQQLQAAQTSGAPDGAARPKRARKSGPVVGSRAGARRAGQMGRPHGVLAANTQPCRRDCGRNTTNASAVCWRCERSAKARAAARFCVRGCGTRLYVEGEVCSECARLPEDGKQRVPCAAGCGRQLRRDCKRDICKACWRARQAEPYAPQLVACTRGCGHATRRREGICWWCRKYPQRALQKERAA